MARIGSVAVIGLNDNDLQRVTRDLRPARSDYDYAARVLRRTRSAREDAAIAIGWGSGLEFFYPQAESNRRSGLERAVS